MRLGGLGFVGWLVDWFRWFGFVGGEDLGNGAMAVLP